MLKKFNPAITATIAFTLLFVMACKKDGDKSSPQQLVQGKWRFMNEYYAEVVGGQPYKDTLIGFSDEYFDFRSDGKAYIYLDGDYDTLTYKVLNANSMIFDGDTATIKTLTDKKFTIYDKVIDGPDWFEVTFNFEK